MLFTFCTSDHELALFGLEIISIAPVIICELGELFLKVRDTIYSVEEIENFSFETCFSYFAFSDPKEPFFVIATLEELHSNEGIS